MLDEIVDGYLDVIDRFEDAPTTSRTTSRWRRRSEGAATRSARATDLPLRQRVVRFRRLAAPMREVVDLLLETPTIDARRSSRTSATSWIT